MASGLRCLLISLLLGMLSLAAPLAAQAQGAQPGTGVVPPSISNTTLQRQQRIGPSTAQPVPPGPPAVAERIEFQDFVAQSTGRDLPIFGSELFRNVPSTFAPVDNIPVTSDYIIGPGDEIMLRAWGQLDVDYAAVVDRTGAINIPKVGTINVAGIKYQDLQAHLKTAIGRVFRNFDLTVSLGELRAIQVFVVGQARRPGSYTVSSMSTLVNAVFAAGGPSAKGSMRSIQLKRGNKVVTELDLYDLLISGDKSKDAPLLPGDVIYVAPVGSLVAISGSVNVPAIFELKKDGALGDLIAWAGGLASTASGQKATLERIDDHKTRNIAEFNLDAAGTQIKLRDGDLVTIYAVASRIENAVTLRGNVAQPGRFPWRQGMRVTDIIPNSNALISRHYWLRKNQTVGFDKTVAELLKKEQPREISPVFAQNAPVGLGAGQGLAARPEEKTRIKSADEIKRNLDEVNWDYAVIERINPKDLGTTLIPFNLGKAVLEGDPAQNLLLQPGDVLTVFSVDDVAVPIAKQTKYVRLEGEFTHPGIYSVEPGETLRQLVARVGGLSQNAFLFGAEFTRESNRIYQQKKLEEAVNRLEREIQSSAISRSRNALTADDAAAGTQDAQAQQALIAKLREVKATGRIVLEVPSDETTGVKDLPDLVLEDSDRFIVPSKPSTINVIGAVYNENAFVFRPEKRLTDYLRQAGGVSRTGDKADVYLLRVDGSVISKRQSGWLMGSFDGERLMPGDTIVVPEDFERTTWTKTLKDYGQILYQFGLGAAALKVLKGP
jgi:protein involved in polysaccharide export with SLBB domain